jgi:hypothetical protein
MVILVCCLATKGFGQGPRTASAANLPDQNPISLPRFPGVPDELSQGRRPGLPATEPARQLMLNGMKGFAYGPALEATLAQRATIAGKSIRLIGQYMQLGTGRCKLVLRDTVSAPNDCCMLQVNDGHLAWTWRKLDNQTVDVERVDVLKLDESINLGRGEIPARFRVAGLVETLDSILRDYVLQLAKAELEGKSVYVVRGSLHGQSRRRLLQNWGGADLPEFIPDYVRVIFAVEPEQMIVVQLQRIEYWRGNPDQVSGIEVKPQLCGVLEVTDYRPLTTGDELQFSFPSEKSRLDHINRTEDYIRLLSRISPTNPADRSASR